MPFPQGEKVIDYLVAVREITPQHPYFAGINAHSLPLCQAAIDMAISGQEDLLDARQCTCLIRVLRGEHDVRGYLPQEFRQAEFPRSIAWLDFKRSTQPPRSRTPHPEIHPASTNEPIKPPYFAT